MRYLSVCSGIEAASVAWHDLGWQPVGFSEIEKFPSQVLATRFPGVRNYGDMTKFREWDIESEAVDLLVGGTPCQAFSVAGLRKGLSDPRGNLALTFVAMVDWFKPEWVVWENVPGVLSSNGGRDFGALLGALGQLGYGWAYRILDAQYFGVAQRRRRVFLVAHSSGDPRRAAEVLFEPSCLRGDPAPSREAGQGFAGDVVSGTVSSKWAKGTGAPAGDECYNLTLAPVVYESRQTFSSYKTGCFKTDSVSTTITKNTGAGGESQNPAWVVEPAVAVQQAIGFYATGGTHGVTASSDLSPSVKVGSGTSASPPGVAVQQQMAGDPVQVQWASGGGQTENLTAQALRAGAEHNYQFVRHEMAVRRLTPVECERLQGFLDGWTDIKPGGKDTPDSPRYKALGNSMAVPVMAWIGKRLQDCSIKPAN